MSLATSIKEFSDVLNQISTANELNGTFSSLTFLREFFLFIANNLVGAILYILTFNWLRDFSYLPLLAPRLNPSSFFQGSYFEDPLSHILSFSRVPSLLSEANSGRVDYGTNQFISGFINSFFFSLPFSLPHLISMRRFLSQGVSAGVTSVLGTLAAHFLLLVGVLYGLRFLIIPWFSLEPLNYIVGILIVVTIVNELVQEKKVYVNITLKPKPVNLFKIGALNFMLTWCEESTVFHSFNHLTLNAHNTYLDLYPSGSVSAGGALDSFLSHTTYLLAFILGSCVFSILFYLVFLQSTQYISQWTGFALAKVARTINKVVLFLILAFTLSSFPYYGLDYLLGKVGGFLPEDPAYIETVLSPTVIKMLDHDSPSPPENGSNKIDLPFDVNYFDHGVYLIEEEPLIYIQPLEDFIPDQLKKARGVEESSAPVSEMEIKNSFEELNYRGEYAWTFYDRYIKSEGNEGFLSKLTGGQAFAKSKNHYIALKEKALKMRATAARQAASQIPLGSISVWKEGVLPFSKEQSFIESSQESFDKATGGEIPLIISDFSERPTDFESFKYQAVNDFSEWGSPLSRRAFEKDKQDTTFDTGTMIEYTSEIPRSSASEDEKINEYGEEHVSVEKIIKAKYLFNPVYRTLIKTDIDAFLARQPSNHNLAANQEYNLATKRQLLEKYYNWLRYYAPFEDDLKEFYEIPETKSFVDSVYHQQFKGTLQIAQRLFSVTFNPDDTTWDSYSPESEKTRKKRRVLSYDQTLYTDTEREALDENAGREANENPFLHEQLLSDSDTGLSSQKRSKQKRSRGLTAEAGCLPFLEKGEQVGDRANLELTRSPVNSKSEITRASPSTDRALPVERLALEQRNNTKSITTFEDLESKTFQDEQDTDDNPGLELLRSACKEFQTSRSPFIEESNSSPIYAGWDDRLRQFVITNKFNFK